MPSEHEEWTDLFGETSAIISCAFILAKGVDSREASYLGLKCEKTMR